MRTIEVVQASTEHIAGIPTNDSSAQESKPETLDRTTWLQPHERMATLIARGSKPDPDALVETAQRVGRVPMGLTLASGNRRAWTIKEPIAAATRCAASNS
jgi:hypothetical protein